MAEYLQGVRPDSKKVAQIFAFWEDLETLKSNRLEFYIHYSRIIAVL